MSIFLLDDDEEDCMLFSMACHQSFPHYALTVFNTPSLLFAALERQRPDRIYIDYQMPLLNGVEVYQRLQANPEWSTIPVCLITSLSLVDELAHQHNLTPALWHTKPTEFAGFNRLLEYKILSLNNR